MTKAILDSMYREEASMHGCLAQFDEIVANGGTPAFASMICMRSAPGTGGSEQAFWNGTYRTSNGKLMNDDKRRSHGLADMPRDMAERMIAKAKRAGVQIQGKWYMSGLADARGVADPEAWVGDISDIKRVAVKRNLNVHGIVEHQGTLAPPPPEKPLSDRLVRESVHEMLTDNPGLATKSPRELREMAIDKHGAPSRNSKKRVRTGRGKSFVDLDG
jgi:hypothetical protein